MNRACFPPLLLVAALLGCDSTPTLGPKTPHGGVLLPIPDKKGSAEFVMKRVGGQDEQVQLVVYLYGPDDKPMASPPTVATFKPSTRGAKSVDLKPGGDADSSLTSDPFAGEGEIDGELSMTIDGKPIKLPVKVR